MRKMSFSHVPHDQGDGGRLIHGSSIASAASPHDAACLKVVVFGPLCYGFVIPSWNNALRGIH
jgi:hypothetical protein